MNFGKMHSRIELQSSSATNDYGEELLTWATYATVWAHIEPLSGRELLRAEAVDSQNTVRVRIRYNSSVDSTDRIRFGSRIFEINSVSNPDEKNKELELLCSEVK